MSDLTGENWIEQALTRMAQYRTIEIDASGKRRKLYFRAYLCGGGNQFREARRVHERIGDCLDYRRAVLERWSRWTALQAAAESESSSTNGR